MSKHTPGPWKASLRHGNSDEWEIMSPSDGNWKVATVDTIKANANLIAAAPELLEALKDLAESCDSANGCMGNEHEIDTAEAWAFIAKAEAQA